MEITINAGSVTRATSESIYPIACAKIRHNDTFYQIILHGIWRFKRTVYKYTCLIHRHSLIRYTYIKMRENLFISICFAFQIYCWDPINRLNPVYICVPVPIQGLNFQRHMSSWSLFVLSERVFEPIHLN